MNNKNKRLNQKKEKTENNDNVHQTLDEIREVRKASNFFKNLPSSFSRCYSTRSGIEKNLAAPQNRKMPPQYRAMVAVAAFLAISLTATTPLSMINVGGTIAAYALDNQCTAGGETCGGGGDGGGGPPQPPEQKQSQPPSTCDPSLQSCPEQTQQPQQPTQCDPSVQKSCDNANDEGKTNIDNHSNCFDIKCVGATVGEGVEGTGE